MPIIKFPGGSPRIQKRFTAWLEKDKTYELPIGHSLRLDNRSPLPDTTVDPCIDGGRDFSPGTEFIGCDAKIHGLYRRPLKTDPLPWITIKED